MSIEHNEREKRQRRAAHRSGIQQTRREAGQAGYIRLHSDENPYGCSLHVHDILGSSELYSLPADPVCTDLREALHEYTGFAPERIVAGAGATEIIERLLHGFLEPGDGMITCPPSLPQHNAGASRARITLVQVPLSERFDIDPEAILTIMRRQTNIRMVALSSPNNPTGN